MSSLTIMNFNASRTSSLIKIRNFLNFINQYDPIFVAIQEINITSAIKIFSEKFQVLVNIEEGSKDGIGIVSLIKKDIHIVDTIVGVNGRIIGIKIKNLAKRGYEAPLPTQTIGLNQYPFLDRVNSIPRCG